ncbi:hypothetical protein AB0K14_24720 [Actinosynnema sp. NPDC050801]|uniref:hypothetical protein n=1 Tax=unclassified Actinosynnema TaxID=2637065 RepID=UPI0033EEBC0C
MSHDISPGDAEWDVIADRLHSFMGKMSASDTRRLAADEVSFRKFCSVALQSIAEMLGYTVKNIDEFIRDMRYAVNKGWQNGIERAKANRLRP